MKLKKLKLLCLATLTSMIGLSTQAANLGTALMPTTPSVAAKTTYAKTKYPIVFSHGLVGFNRLGTKTFGMDYFHQILPDLKRNGALPYATRVSPFNSNEVRGEQLLYQVQLVLAITGAEKVNLIGHSQGGPTIRYIGGIVPEYVASMTTVAGVNKGSPMADFLLKTESIGIDKALASVINLFSGAIVWAQQLDPQTLPHDSLASARSLSTAGSLAFNQRFPAGLPSTHCGEGASKENGMRLYSFTGSKPFTNALDPTDYVFQTTSLVVSKAGANDGLVPVCSAHFGQTIRDNYGWNHVDEVNHMFGITGLFEADPVAVYRQHANRLKLQGL